MSFLVLAWLVAGCTPDYAHTAFRCGADPDCPTDQHCVAGRCRRGTALHGDGVLCGASVCGLTQQCCVDGENPARCLAAGDLCPGLTALCDGDEDCDASDHCCEAGVVTCGTDCETVVCRTAEEDCPTGRPNCCFADASVSWGTCSKSQC